MHNLSPWVRRWRLACGLLALSLLLIPFAAHAQEGTPVPEVERLGRVEGQVSNLTAGAQSPAGAQVLLYLLDEFEPTAVLTGTTTTDGYYGFADVPLKEGTTYIATTEYQNVAYGSTFLTYGGEGDLITLDIEAYESGSDPAAITISRLHIIVEFSDETMLVSELYIFDNNRDRVYAGPSGIPDNGTLEIPVPSGASNPVVERSMGESMVPTANSVLRTEAGFLDTLPVRPGTASQQLMLTYEIPYKDGATVAHTLPYRVASVSLFLPDVGLTVTSEQLNPSGQSGMQGMPFEQWDAENLAAGDLIEFRVEGKPDLSLLETSSSTSTSLSMPQDASEFFLSVQAGDNTASWILGAAGLILAVGLVAVFWRRRESVGPESPREELLAELAALDAGYEDGQIPRARYEIERERLVSRLRSWYE